MMFQIEISSAPKKPSRPSIVRPAIVVAAPTWPSTRMKRRRHVALHLHRLVGRGDMVDQQLLLLGRADDLRRRGRAASLWTSQAPTVSIRSTSVRSTTMSSASISLELLGELADPQQGQIAAEPQDAAGRPRRSELKSAVTLMRGGHASIPAGRQGVGWTGCAYSMLARGAMKAALAIYDMDRTVTRRADLRRRSCGTPRCGWRPGGLLLAAARPARDARLCR